MICPVCKESIIVLELHMIEIDYCTKCDGIWLDDGELEVLMEDSEEKEKLLQSFVKAAHSSERNHKCPICHKKMHKVHVGDKNPILIDQCRLGHGLWFDGGELLQILEMGSTETDNKVLSLLKEMFNYKLK